MIKGIRDRDAQSCTRAGAFMGVSKGFSILGDRIVSKGFAVYREDDISAEQRISGENAFSGFHDIDRKGARMFIKGNACDTTVAD